MLDSIPARLPRADVPQMDALLVPPETRSDFIRKGVRREIDARMTAIQRALAERGIETEIGNREARITAYIASERAAGRVVATDDAGVREMLRWRRGRRDG